MFLVGIWACLFFGFLKPGPHLSLGGWLMIHIFTWHRLFTWCCIANPTPKRLNHILSCGEDETHWMDPLNPSIKETALWVWEVFHIQVWTACLHKLSDLLWRLLLFLKTAVNKVKPAAHVGSSWTKKGNDAHFPQRCKPDTVRFGSS